MTQYHFFLNIHILVLLLCVNHNDVKISLRKMKASRSWNINMSQNGFKTENFILVEMSANTDASIRLQHYTDNYTICTFIAFLFILATFICEGVLRKKANSIINWKTEKLMQSEQKIKCLTIPTNRTNANNCPMYAYPDYLQFKSTIVFFL